MDMNSSQQLRISIFISDGNSTQTKTPVEDEKKQKKRMSRQQQQLRSIRTLGVVIIVFLFCWVPFCTFWPISAFCPNCISLPAYEYSYWAAYLNSTVNPWLYFLANRDFRNAFRKLIGMKVSDDWDSMILVYITFPFSYLFSYGGWDANCKTSNHEGVVQGVGVYIVHCLYYMYWNFPMVQKRVRNLDSRKSRVLPCFQ